MSSAAGSADGRAVSSRRVGHVRTPEGNELR